MKALCVLYGGSLESEAFEKTPFFGSGAGDNGETTAFSLALAAAARFPGVQKTVFLGIEGKEYPGLNAGIETVLRPSWNRKSFFEELSKLSLSYDLTYFAWADCPLLDPELAGALAERHRRFAAEYSYADGWPHGFSPEILSPGTAGILAKILCDDEGPVERDALFMAIQKDINAFDIETEISPVDLRPYRLCLAADSKRNLLLLSRLMNAGLRRACDAEKLLSEKPELLRTLPAFFNIQVSSACPQECSLCPYPAYGNAGAPVTARRDFMSASNFASLLDKIAAFAGDAVISLSLWGEISLHPEKMELIKMVLERPALSLVLETSGIGWKEDELKALALAASNAPKRKNPLGHRTEGAACKAPLSWVVSLDAHESARYKEVRGPGFAEAQANAEKILSLFPGNAYVQAVRVRGAEDDIEQFYRFWRDKGKALGYGNDTNHIIIQKYDDFAGTLPKMQVSDLSPVRRRACWHIQRDMNILLDGRVPCCREDLAALKGTGSKDWGNVFNEELSIIWERGERLYLEHCKKNYEGICAGCDEYYTFNF